MKWLVIPSILLALLGVDPKLISKINSAKSEAKKAFLANDYLVAASKYRYLIDSLGVKEDEVLLNLAHCYFNLNDTSNAVTSYQKLLTGPNTDKMLRSNAYQQLGVINNRQGKLEEALSNFKEALKTDPTNEDARYDYEMVKKKLEEKKKQEEQQKKDQNKENQDKKNEEQNKDQQQKDKQNQEKNKQDQQKKDQQQKEQEQKEQSEKDKAEQQKKEQEQKEQQEKEDQKKKKDNNFNPDKMKDMKITEEKAKMILEAMKAQEKQYLQQQKRKAEKPRDKGKPDW
jgi:Ca-activated chloride channel family protein